MKNIAENNLIRFINISKKKNGLFANFKAKGIRGGTVFTASVSVDLGTVDVDVSNDTFEKIIGECANIAVKEFKKTELQFEGLQSI